MRRGKIMNHQRNPTSIARRKFEEEVTNYHTLQRKVKALDARAKLDSSLAQKLADIRKELVIEETKWNDYAAKVKASEPASKAAHAKAPAKKPPPK